MPGEIDTVLREEVIECQRARSEFIRWKLILVAVVGSAALALAHDSSTPRLQPALLALIPLICVYVDSVCLHNDSRIMMIAEFFRTSPHASPAARDYERLCAAARPRFYNEALALFVSSAGLSLLVGLIGLLHVYAPATVGGLGMSSPVEWLLIGSGVAGAVVTGVLIVNFRSIQRGHPPLQILASPQGPPVGNGAPQGPSTPEC